MTRKITKGLVDSLKPASKTQFIFDSELSGFALKITPAVRRIYQLRYRMGGRGTPVRTYTIGPHGPFTPDQARRTAQALLGEVRRGIDVATEKRRRRDEDRTTPTVSALSFEFLNIYGRTKLKPRSYEEYDRAFRSYINPRIGQLRVRDVTHADVERLHHALRATPPTANRAIATLSKFFSWAIRSGYRPDRQNPCAGLEKFKEEPRQRYLSAPEIVALGAGIRECEADGTLSVWHAALFRALLLTGLRKNELRTLKWSQVNFERAVFMLDDTKTGRRDVPLSLPVLELLKSVPRMADNPYVFPGSKQGMPIYNLAKPWARILARAKIAPTRIHDLRHTAASIGVASGASLPLIGGVLGHKTSQSTQRYSHLSDDPVRNTSEAIAAQVAQALNGTQE